MHRIKAKISNNEKLQNNSNFTFVYTPTCIYIFPPLSLYTYHYCYFTQFCKLVRHAAFELIIWIKQTYNPKNVQLIVCLPWYLYNDLIKLQSYTKTKVLTFHMLHQMNIQPEKSYRTTPILHLCICPYVYTCSLHWANITIIIILLHKYVISKTCRFWIDHMYQRNQQFYKRTTNIPHLLWNFMLIRWSYKATPKLGYWLSICNVASNKYPTRKSYKTTPFSHLSHAYMYLHVPYIEKIYQ